MYSTQAQPSDLSSTTIGARDTFQPFSDAKDFSTSLISIWNEVKVAKEKGIVKSVDDQYWIAYRQAEFALRDKCEENEQLKARLAQLEKTSL